MGPIRLREVVQPTAYRKCYQKIDEAGEIIISRGGEDAIIV